VKLRWASTFSLLRASPAICKYVTLLKIIFHIQVLVIYFFWQPHPLNWIGSSKNRLGITNSKPPGPIIMMGRSETLSWCEIIIFVTLFFCRCTTQAVQWCSANAHFPELNWHILTFLHLIFTVQVHILSTTEDALIVPSESARKRKWLFLIGQP